MERFVFVRGVYHTPKKMGSIGWAITTKNKIEEKHAEIITDDTSAPRAELLAAIRGLSECSPDDNIKMFTSSEYVHWAFTSHKKNKKLKKYKHMDLLNQITEMKKNYKLGVEWISASEDETIKHLTKLCNSKIEKEAYKLSNVPQFTFSRAGLRKEKRNENDHSRDEF